MIALACRTILVFAALLGGLTIVGLAEPPPAMARLAGFSR